MFPWHGLRAELSLLSCQQLSSLCDALTSTVAHRKPSISVLQMELLTPVKQDLIKLSLLCLNCVNLPLQNWDCAVLFLSLRGACFSSFQVYLRLELPFVAYGTQFWSLLSLLGGSCSAL